MSTTQAPIAAHESPARHYVMIWLVLVALTVLTVGVTYLDMKKFAVLTAMLIATTKAGLVLSEFMHLRRGSRTHIVIVAVAMAILAIFLVLTFTDVLYLYP